MICWYLEGYISYQSLWFQKVCSVFENSDILLNYIKKTNSTKYAAGAKEQPVLLEQGFDFLNMREFILVFLRPETPEISASSVISVTLDGGNQSFSSSSSRAH